MDNDSVIICSGGFDPLHSGHIEMFKMAAANRTLVVGVNSDSWLSRKNGNYFMPYTERAAIVSAIQYVSQVIDFNDDDNTAVDLLTKVRRQYPHHNMYFANGGDRTADTLPCSELVCCYALNIISITGIGGNHKLNSSSEIRDRWIRINT